MLNLHSYTPGRNWKKNFEWTLYLNVYASYLKQVIDSNKEFDKYRHLALCYKYRRSRPTAAKVGLIRRFRRL